MAEVFRLKKKKYSATEYAKLNEKNGKESIKNRKWFW